MDHRCFPEDMGRQGRRDLVRKRGKKTKRENGSLFLVGTMFLAREPTRTRRCRTAEVCRIYEIQKSVLSGNGQPRSSDDLEVTRCFFSL